MTRAIFMVETGMWSRRAFVHMVVSGVFERHPRLKLVLTEQGSGWVPTVLESLDSVIGRMRVPGSTEALFGYESIAQLSLKPSEYFARNCWIGATGLAPAECEARYEIGVDKLMWGSDFPHSEGTFPFTKQAFQVLFSDVPGDEVRKMIGATAAELYTFDPVALGEAAARIGPTVEATSRPLEHVPEGAARQRSFDRSNRALAI